jgi:hypothetical protein
MRCARLVEAKCGAELRSGKVYERGLRWVSPTPVDGESYFSIECYQILAFDPLITLRSRAKTGVGETHLRPLSYL